eukprot:102935_1
MYLWYLLNVNLTLTVIQNFLAHFYLIQKTTMAANWDSDDATTTATTTTNNNNNTNKTQQKKKRKRKKKNKNKNKNKQAQQPKPQPIPKKHDTWSDTNDEETKQQQQYE